MDKYVNNLIKRHLGSFMDRSRDKLARSDKLYKRNLEDSQELEKRYDALLLDKKERILINDYISCLILRENRMADISYMAGVGDAIKFLNAIGLLKGSKKDLEKVLKKVTGNMHKKSPFFALFNGLKW